MIEEAKKSFAQQGFMKTLGAELIHIEEGLVKIKLCKTEGLTQQYGYFHAGALTSIMDVACGYAALTTMSENSDVLSVEFKTNLLRAANADEVIATGKVVKSGKTLVFCEASVEDTSGKLYTTMQATMICLQKR